MKNIDPQLLPEVKLFARNPMGFVAVAAFVIIDA